MIRIKSQAAPGDSANMPQRYKNKSSSTRFAPQLSHRVTYYVVCVCVA